MCLKNYSLATLVLLAFGLFVTSCQKNNSNPYGASGKPAAQYDHTVVTDWNDLFLRIERHAAGYRPGPAPRALAYMGFSAYEACITGMPDYNSMASRYSGITIPALEDGKEYHWPTVVNNSYGYLMRRFFPTASDALFQEIGTTEASHNSLYQNETTPEIYERSVAYGQAVAAAVWEWSKTDVEGHDGYLDPLDQNDPLNPPYDWQAHYTHPGDWVATFPGPGKPMYAYWGQTRTFAIDEADKLCPPPLPQSDATNSALYSQALEVYAHTTANATYEDNWIAEFWSDDLVDLTFSPGPRWMAIADQVLVNENSSLETALYTAVKVGMAVSDAAVACWHSKYVYNVERPETYIQRNIDPTWKPILYNPINNQTGVTPSFPAYPSGHSTMGGAGAEVLTNIFGINYAMTDNCHKDRTEFNGTPRSFNSFYEMAIENAWSRIPLGVHFRMDSEAGVNLGYRVARKVNNLPWKK